MATTSTEPKSFDGVLDSFRYEAPPSTGRQLRPRPAVPTTTSGPGASSTQMSPKLSTPASKTHRIAKPRSSSSKTSLSRSVSSTSSTTSKKQKASYRPPSTYASYAGVPDAIGPDLLILFVGVNPGLASSQAGHAYASPSNRFWPTLYSSGVVLRPCTCQDDQAIVSEFNVGNTNIVSRPSRNEAELSREERVAGWQTVEEKVREWRPEAVGVVGKGIWEAAWEARWGRRMGKGEFRYGWQGDEQRVAAGEGWEGARVFVASSTSGLAAGLSVKEKEEIWRPLGEWMQQRRREREEERSGTAA